MITVGAIPIFNLPAKTFTIIGLLLFGLGSGGIKPCVSVNLLLWSLLTLLDIFSSFSRFRLSVVISSKFPSKSCNWQNSFHFSIFPSTLAH